MKHTKIPLAVIAILFFWMVSCQKEFTPEDVVTAPPTTLPTGDSTCLDEMYFIDISGGVADTVGFVKYTYDSNKRLIEKSDTPYHPDLDYGLLKVTYYYNGNDTLPYKSLQVESSQTPTPTTSTTNSFYFYNAAGQKVKDSSVIERTGNIAPYYFVSNYIYVGNNIYGSSTFDYSSATGIINTQRDTATTDNDGNVILNHSTRFLLNNGSQIVASRTVSTVTYDNKPSPFARLSNFKSLAVLPTGETLLDGMSNKNNRQKIYELQTDNSGNPTGENDEDFTGDYIYRADGYPIEINDSQTYNGVTTIYKTAFVYKKL